MKSSLSAIFKHTRVSRSIYQSALRLSEADSNNDIRASVATKFQVFRNETGIIYDIEEERKRQDTEDSEASIEDLPSAFSGLYLKRESSSKLLQNMKTKYKQKHFVGGIEGVFDIEDLVLVLRKENAKNLCVIKFPKELKYVDYLLLVDGISYRHMVGMAHFVRKVFKMKRQSGDIIPKIEGESCRNWIALDLGNIALHIFSRQTREHYDLETLWCLGEQYEKRVKNKNVKEEIYQSYLDAAIASTAEQNESSKH